MRRALSVLLTALALLAGTAAVAAYAVNQVVAGRDQPGTVAKALLDTPDGRAAVRDQLETRIRENVPGMTDAQSRAIATQVVADPRLPAALDTLADDTSRKAALDTALAEVGKRNPRLAEQVRTQADRVVPTAHSPVLDRLDRAQDRLHTVATTGAVVAVVLAALALLLGPRRDKTVRSIGLWGLLLGGVGLLALWLLPGWLTGLDGLTPLLAAGGVEAADTGLRLLFGALLGGGVVALVLGAVGGAAHRR